jgi:hypothetical protein
MTAVDEADFREPIVAYAGPRLSRTEYQITYRDPETGQQFTRLVSDTSVWREQRRKLQDMGYDVLVQRHQVDTTPWEVVGDNE